MPPFRLSDVMMVARLTRDFRSFVATPIAGQQAFEKVKEQLATRDQRFVRMVERLIFRHAESPYRKLFELAGCEFGDVRKLLAKEGLESTLGSLASAGVYLNIDEFRGRKDTVRGSQRFRFTDADFDNPTVSPHLEARTGGSRGSGMLLKLDLDFIRDRALTTALAYSTHGLEEHDAAIWMVGGLRPALQYAKAGKMPVAWFSPVKTIPLKSVAIVRYLSMLGKRSGYSMPRPVFLDLQDPASMASWLARRVESDGPVCLTANASSAVRACIAAQSMGLDLGGVAFIIVGEPFTQVRKEIVRASGAYPVVGYGLNEAGTVGFGCKHPNAADDVHMFTHAYGLIQRRREMDESNVAVDAYLLTSLLSSGPKVLLNVEIGDYGVMERRNCGCLLGELGLDTHLREIRSFEKLTTEGVTFVKSELLRILEEELPSRFGGRSTDYQLVEETGTGGTDRLVLMVSPRVGAIDEDLLCRTFFHELRKNGGAERLMAKQLSRAGALSIRRQPPIATRSGKILPFHTTRESGQL